MNKTLYLISKEKGRAFNRRQKIEHLNFLKICVRTKIFQSILVLESELKILCLNFINFSFSMFSLDVLNLQINDER